MRSPIRSLLIVPGLTLLALALGSAPDAAAQQTPPRTVRIPPVQPRYTPPADTPPAADTAGLRFRLSEGRRSGAEAAQGRPAGGTRLSEQETERLLRRLPPLRAELSAADSFIFPPQSPPPPRTGTEVRAPFPPPDTATPPALPGPRALEVVRRSPEGAVELGVGVTVVFSQPMVPLSSVGEVAAQAVPARISPRAAGRWRWIDVQTLVFEPEGRLPMATRYTVEVPAGTRSATGGDLGRPVTWTFSTPPARALGAHPQGEPATRAPVLLLTWDQQVSAQALLPYVRVQAQGRTYPVRIATTQEIEADERVRNVVRGEERGRWTAFRTTTPLPGDAEVRVTITPGAPSEEGPLRTEVAQEWTFRTYGPLRVRESACGYGEGCRPGVGWRIELTNPLDPEAWSDTLLRVEPSLRGMDVHVYGNTIMIQGQSRPNTVYRVHLHPSIRDRFGQRLGQTAPRTFTVTVPVGRLWSIGEGFVVLDPAGPRRVPVYSHDFAQLRVRVLRVRPEDWPRYVASISRRRGTATPALPGQEVVSRLVTPGAEPGRVYESMVDVSAALEGGLGHAIVAVEPVRASEEERQSSVYLWVQSTRIGLAALADDTCLLGWATSLADGAPLRGVALSLLDVPGTETTDADGIASLPLPAAGSPDEGRVLVGRLGLDVVLLPERAGRGGWGGWQRQTVRSSLAWYVVTDRNLYRPGEEVRFKGWVRRMERGEEGGPRVPGTGAGPVRFTVVDSEGNEIGRGSARLSALGGFDGAFTVPPGTHLGPGLIRLVLEGTTVPEGQSWEHGFVVQEFRRPEFVVGATADPGPHRVGGSAEVTANAAYYSGGGLPGAEVKWTVRATPTRFVPPGWDTWSFGEEDGFTPWGRPSHREPVTRTFEGRTDASGNHVLRIDFERAEPPLPSSVQAEATVLDVNRQTWTASAQLLVHPADVYVGLRTGRFWVEAGKPFDVEVVVLDLAGRPVAGREVEVRAGVTTGEWEGGTWKADSTARTCRLVSAAAPLRCTFRAERGGRFRVAAVTRDEAGRPSWTETALWVSGGVVERPGEPLLGEERQVELIPDRKEYRPGETAEVLLRLPFFPARGVLSVVRSGIARTESFDASGATHVVRVPIGEGDIPNVGLRVDLVGRAGAAGGARGTDFATGSVELQVPPLSRTLQVSAAPRDTLAEPDTRTTVEVTVRDAAGRPVAGSEVMLAVVDEAVLALTGYRHPNPVAVFYPQRPINVRANKTRPNVLLAAQDFRPEPGTLVGRVTDARSGMPLGGAAVALRGTPLRATTDAHGRFRIDSVAPGTYTVTVERAGYARSEQEVRVGTEAHPALAFALVHAAGAPEPEEALESIVVTGATQDFSGVGAVGGVAVSAQAAHPAMAGPPPPSPVAPERRAREGAQEGPQIAVRTDFDALAHFSPAVLTDAAGRARVEVDLPSNLTRYRVVAVAVSGDRLYGLGESGITARRALMVRPSPPRFLNFGDRFELPVTVQNRSGRPLEVSVAVRASGIEITEAGQRVTVPAGDRVEVRFPALAARAGMARFQVAVEGGAFTDAAEQALPVWTPATAEAFATYGAVDSGTVVLPLRVPGGVLPGFGGLEVTTSSTALQELTDALLYLVRYPFECSEQIASRVVSVAALRDVLTAFRAEGMPPPEALRAAVHRDVALLAELQNEDGGWPFWKRGDRSWPFVSVHVAHALQRAREKGFTVPDRVMERARAYLENVEERTPRTYPPRVRNAVASYAVYVRGRMQDPAAVREAESLLRRTAPDSLTLEARGWLLTTLATRGGSRAAVDSLARQVMNRATETAATATFATSYGEEGEYLLLHSSRRTDAVLLEALIAAAPRSDLIPKTVRGLLGHRRRGRWESTQENAWVLLALDRYFDVYERQTPEFMARAWLGERYVGGHSFHGRTTERHHVAVPMRVLAAGDSATRLVLDKEGPGRMYYRAGMRYAPASLQLTAAQQGFAVQRAYEAVDDSADVRRDADGSWRVRAGARVRVRVTMTAPARRHHVALVDPLPAGFEPLNPELAGTQSDVVEQATPGRPRPPAWGWMWRWWEHQNLRDDRAEAFTSLLPAGTYTYTYLARATTPGTFVVPPARAEEMYHPETFGRTATERVRVEER